MQREFKVSLSPQYYSEVIRLSQYDANYPLIITVFDKTAQASINGMTAYFEGTRADGLSFRYSGTAVGSKIQFTIDTALTAVAGKHTGEIVLYDGSGLWFGSANVQILVEKAARPNNAIDADVEEARSIAEQIQEIVDTAAETTTASTQQIVGDLTEELSTVKEDLRDIETEVGMHIPPSGHGTLPATSGVHVLIDPVEIISGHSYSLQYSIAQASNVIAYFYVVSDDGQTTIASGNLNAGATSGTKNFTASISDENAYIAVNANARPLVYSVTLIDNNVSHDSRITILENDVSELDAFTGISDSIEFTTKAYISTPSQGGVVNLTPITLNGCACASVPCNKGDLFTLYGTPRDNSATRAYMWVNGDTGRCFYRYDETAVLDGSVIVAPVTGTLVVNFSTSAPYSAYKGIRNLHNHIISNIRDIESIVNSPLKTMPEYITNNMAYKPLGQLQNSYLCLSCDDGSAELETYTIPMLLDKNVPCTFGLWATHSEYGATPVFSPSVILRTQSGIDAVLSAVENGCEVAQHGTVEWTDMSEAELNSFFDREEEAFADMGITVKGAICPSHCVNNKVRAIAGGRFGSVRSGYNGFKSKADQQAGISGDVFTPYGVLTGARSNCYSYTSFNTIDKTLNELKSILDNAIANNMCMIVYWHDFDLTASQKADLEAFIDYAKTTAVTFTTLSKIPTLI